MLCIFAAFQIYLRIWKGKYSNMGIPLDDYTKYIREWNFHWKEDEGDLTEEKVLIKKFRMGFWTKTLTENISVYARFNLPNQPPICHTPLKAFESCTFPLVNQSSDEATNLSETEGKIYFTMIHNWLRDNFYFHVHCPSNTVILGEITCTSRTLLL